MEDTSPTAYFASISQVLEQHKGSKYPDIEVLAYCYAAVISMVDLAVVQNQHAQIFSMIKRVLLASDASDYTCKYGVIALQFLLHSKTLGQWSIQGSDGET